MAAPIAAVPDFHLRSFAEFDLVPELLRPPRSEWAGFLAARSVNLDHVEDGDLPGPGGPHAHMANDAWDLCQFLGLVSDDGPTADGRALLAASDGPAAVRERIRSYLVDWRAGGDGAPVIDLLGRAVQQVADGGGVLPGLLLGEMACLIEAARHGPDKAETALANLDRLRSHVNEKPPDTSGLSRIGRTVVMANKVNELALADDPMSGMTMTGARATAMLLIHSGLFSDISPIGPANCLGPPKASGPAPVLDRDGKVQSAEIDPDVAAMLMMCLHEHSFTTNEALVFPALGLRRAAGTGEDVSEWRKINKALAMEMLSAVLLSGIDGPTSVFAQWRTEDGRPLGHAPAGHTDIGVVYPRMSSGGRFLVVAEVSAKREVSSGFFRKQLEQALEHGRRLQKDLKGTVYALVVNGGRVASDPKLQAEYLRFVGERGLRSDGPVRPIPICAVDLAGAVRRLEMAPSGRGAAITPEGLAGAFGRLASGLAGPPPDDRDWMVRELVGAAEKDPGFDMGGGGGKWNGP